MFLNSWVNSIHKKAPLNHSDVLIWNLDLASTRSNGQTIELFLVSLSGQHVENCQIQKEQIKGRSKGGRYSCELCDYRTVRFYDLLDHNENQHKAVNYACPQFDVKTSTRKSMMSQMKSCHTAEFLSCPDCSYVTKKVAHLTVHRESIHEGRRHACDLFSLQVTQKSHLK